MSELEVKYSYWENCFTCDGTGMDDGEICDVCDGDGNVEIKVYK